MMIIRDELFSAPSIALPRLGNIPRKIHRSRGIFCIHTPLHMYSCTYIFCTSLPLVCRFCVRLSRSIILLTVWKTRPVILFQILEAPLYEKRWKYIQNVYSMFARSCDECVPRLKGLPDPECAKIGYLR